MAFISLKDDKSMSTIQTHWSEVLNTLYETFKDWDIVVVHTQRFSNLLVHSSTDGITGQF